VEAARIFALVERWRMTLTDGRLLIPHPYKPADFRPREPYGPWLRAITEAEFLDPARWLDVAYVLVAFPLVMVEVLVSVILWTTAVAMMLAPIAFALTPWEQIDPQGRRWAEVALQQIQQIPDAALVITFVIGAFLLPVAALTTRGMAVLHRAVVEGMLCISPAEALRRDNERLRGSRSAAIELEASELRRIERDLHDGAQQRLVMLAIDLTLAEDKVESDPAAAKVLIAGARDQARQALGEIRDVVRGSAPAILMDRGLAAALSAVAGRSAVPTFIDNGLAPGERLPHAVERAAYYVVSESITNVAKHTNATRCDIYLRRGPGAVLVEVRDNGSGGATIVAGGGLAGLKDRTEALDGRFEIMSPVGGPTAVRVQLPVVPI
jgi:signal transduction histidine kinase